MNNEDTNAHNSESQFISYLILKEKPVTDLMNYCSISMEFLNGNGPLEICAYFENGMASPSTVHPELE